ncbi:hypothetical protein [Coxiella endosymbiont of Ornithodoros maritimus]|uniref:hypothetical protein n=1 Tax=Coxiella endosymbiont of Ornithodoros maritimus TaxID=1656172 RepID=UPI002263C00C|nr:hypothetical protein [Coxiella endosymbiont of Ornithodoros maritimus]
MSNQINFLDLLELLLIRRNDRLIREYFEGIPHYLNIDAEQILWSRVQRILNLKHKDTIEICINLYLTVDKELAFDFLKEALSPMQYRYGHH